MAAGIKPHNLHAGFLSFKTIISLPLLPQCLRSERVRAKIQNMPKSTVPLDMQQEKGTFYYRNVIYKLTVVNICFITGKENSCLGHKFLALWLFY